MMHSSARRTLPAGLRALRPAAALVAAAWLAGCAVAPQPLSPTAQDVAAERRAMLQAQEPIAGPITLEEALARAAKYNLDHRVKLLEQALAQNQLDLSRFDMLPKLTASAGYSSRDNELGASSRDLATGNQSLVPSTSTDKTRNTADLVLSWNVLDFGVSYYQAQQQADRVLAAQERRRKVVQQLMLEVRQAYWQAVGAQLLRERIADVLRQVDSALADSRRIDAERLQSPMTNLAYQRQLLDMVAQLEEVQAGLGRALPRLASLLNLEPSTQLQVVAPAELRAPKISMPLQRMEEMALMQRPDLMEARYVERIGVNETHRAMARLFPGLELSIGGYRDSNSFLVNNQWGSAGVQISWNLLNLLNADNIRKTADSQLALAREQHLALNMAVLSQVHIAYRDFLARQRQFELMTQMDQIDQRLLEAARGQSQASAQGKLLEIRAATSAVMSQLRRYERYGNLQSAYGQMLATLGLDPLPQTMQSHDLAAVREAIAEMERKWAGEL